MAIRDVRTPDTEDVERAWEVVRGVLPATPLVRPAAGGPALKLETMQPTGSFKVRGALAALAEAGDDQPVVTASAGNHGLGVAFAATRLGRRATVVVPANASPAKVAALRGFDIELVQTGTTYAEAEAHALELGARGARFVSPYNDPGVIAGQGTLGLELGEQTSGPLTVVCALGGGGLASGIGLWAATRTDVRVIGVESAAAPSMAAAVAAGHQVPIEVGPTLADGIAANLEPGSVTIDLVAKHVDELLTVTESELHTALRYLAGTHGLVSEGAGAVALAAVLAGKVESREQVVAVVSGRNVALPVLAEVLASSHS
ncbi:threonine ammonia-lyase [Prauserella cavernicola]|uniref:Pyridoxal-phosphate dependent enzyme n=1 Tax=Prauserella cavernicola TaxID=2800127 RepID=A0A934QYX6_9PSEU|nr:pyridoxal-phosphate dependent enzyme [Prauserella cavernicola]MBK1789123.1 pyridoxal-phosphate dependent enzyme [Prauserella cavernicola]